ncbi:MAG: hypothetical protein ACFFDW_14015, partial [Candidatus Thorarchaeota archaeon]
EHIVVKELATPLTFERYNLVSKGAWYGTKFTQVIAEFKTPIKNLFFAGSNVDGSGVSTALTSGFKTGKFLIKELAKQNAI